MNAVVGSIEVVIETSWTDEIEALVAIAVVAGMVAVGWFTLNVLQGLIRFAMLIVALLILGAIALAGFEKLLDHTGYLTPLFSHTNLGLPATR